MPYIEVAELAAERDSGELYLLVNFWRTKAWHDAGKPIDLTNDFVMQLRLTETRIVTNASGWPQRLSDGVFVDPATLTPDDTTEWARETVSVPRADIIATIKANIKAYYLQAVANGWRGDHTGDSSKPFYVSNVLQNQAGSQRLARVLSDRFGLLSDAQIVALRGTKVNVP